MPTLYWCPHQVLKATGAPESEYLSKQAEYLIFYFQFHSAPGDRIYSLYIGLMTSDKFVHLSNTLYKDVFVDPAIWFCWMAYYLLKIPYFIRQGILVPLVQMFVSSELVPGERSKHHNSRNSTANKFLDFRFPTKSSQKRLLYG